MIWQYCPERFMIPDVNATISNEIQSIIQSAQETQDVEVEELDEEEEDFYQNAKINFWACHTNFEINNKTFQIIKKTPGIEFITVKTRYCFLIAVGKLFNFNEVRKTIEQELKCTSDVNSTISTLKELSEYWVCLVKQNGEIEYAVGEDEEHIFELYKDFEFYEAYVARYGGRIILSEKLENEKDIDEDDNKFKSDI